MTKVAAPVVKMVEPLFELIDFEEEIKVEKISKEECKTPEVESKNYSDEEIKIEKNIINKIPRKKKLLVKDILNIVASETNSNSNDSHLSENSNKSSKSEASALPRRNPSRRTSLKDEVVTKLMSDKVNLKKEVKKSFTTNRSAKRIRRTKTQKSLDLPLSNENSSTLETNSFSKMEKNASITLSHVPSENHENEVSSTSEKSINKEILNEILKPSTPSFIDNSIENDVPNEKTESDIKEILETETLTKRENENKETYGELQQIQILEQSNCTKKENLNNDSNENISTVGSKEEQKDISMEPEVNIPVEHEAESHIQKVDITEITESSNTATPSAEQLSEQQEETTPKQINITVTNPDVLNTNITDTKIESKTAVDLNEIRSEEVVQNIQEISENNIDDLEASIEKERELTSDRKDENYMEVEKKDLNTVLCEIKPLTDEEIVAEKTIENVLNEEENNLEENTISEEKLSYSDETKTDVDENSKQRFFIFGDEIEEENSTCKLAMTTTEIVTVNEQICGEIIHKTQEEFSINCYMCWDDDNWTFKKFNDLELFSIHLNSEHSNDQINFQNQRGNSYSLDFVNENSCVMPQSMWFGIYNEMISFKCGFAKIDINGYIHYSCLECQHAFKNFNTFTKHILGRETKELKIGETEETSTQIMLSDNPCTNSSNNDDKKHGESEKTEAELNENSLNIENIKEVEKENIEYNDFDNINNKEVSQPEGKNENDVDVKKSSKDESNTSLAKPKGILESILELGKVNMENVGHEPKSPILPADSNVNASNGKENEEKLPDLISTVQISEKSDIEEHVSDIYNYKQITSALFDIFDEGAEESISSKLDKILSVGQSYRDIKEKEKMDSEEREKQKILSLSIQKDTRPRIEGSNIITKHILDLNDKLALLTCKYCSRRYTCLTNLREHFRIHVGDRIVICFECKRGFSKKSNLEEHIKTFHLDSSDKNIDINALGDNRKEIAKNTNITVNENNPKEKGFKCKYCIRFLSNRTVLEDHLRLHFGEIPLKCEKCDLQFLKKSIYDNHITQVHELRDTDDYLENFEGNSCDKENNKAFSNKAKNKFKCKECPETFPTKIGLIDHLIISHNDGEFQCRFCELRFDSKKKRSYHEKLHKVGTKFQCNFCSKCFANLFTLELHENSHKMNADFKCRFCDHYFASDRTRMLHEEVHETTGKANNNLQIQTVDIATILQMNNEQGPITSNGNANDSNGTSSDATDRSSNQNTTSRNLMVKKIIKKIKRGKRDPNSPLDCRYCKKHFESPHQLSYHERLHEIGKKYQCNICDKILATSYALELHLTAHIRKNNLKFNGSNILSNQLTMHRKGLHEFKPKIEIVSDVSLAPTETMEILNNFFKRDLPTITVTTTSDDESFQKIGVNDIEKNLAAHVLRDTDPYYQLMADYSYQYQMYQNQSAPKVENENFAEIASGNIEVRDDSETSGRPKKGRKKKLNIDKMENTMESHKIDLSYSSDQNNLDVENKNVTLENLSQDSTQNLVQSTQPDNLNASKDLIKKKDKKKITPDINRTVTNVFIKCEYCNKKLNSSDTKLLNRHKDLHLAGDTHKCAFCSKCFGTLYYLDKHLRVHHLNKVIQYKCPSCDSVYVLKEALRRHEHRAHKDNNSNSKIENKNIEVSKIDDDDINKNNNIDSSSLVNSMNEIDDQQNYQIKDQEFAIPEVPKKTTRRSRSKELKLFDCNFCEKAFSTFGTLQIHINKSHKRDFEDFEENYNFKCTYENCKKRFDCQTNLDKHLRLHESGFKCSICSKKTISQISLDHHMRSHGILTSFGCNFCKSRFTMQLTKEIHERKNHNKEHNLSFTQITEALTSASSGLTAIQPVEVIQSPDDDDQQMTTELTPLTTLTSLTSLTPLTPLQPTAVFHHSNNDASVLQSQQQSQLQVTNSAMELTSLEPSTISEATKLSLTLLEPSALCELTAFTEPSVVPMHTANLTDISSSYDHSTGILHHDTILGDLASSSATSTFEAQLITTQCNNSSTMLNTSSASSDYAVTNMDTSQITQHSKKPRISDSNMHLESFTLVDDNSSQTEHNSQPELTNFSTFDSTTQFLSTKTDQNMMFTDLNISTKSIMSDSASLEPLTYSDSMPLSEATTILELTSSSHPTSSSEATAFSESNINATHVQNSSGKKKRNSGGKSRGQKPNDNDILNLEGDFDVCSENNNFKCTLCRRVYESWIKFRKHNEYHALRPHQCPICPCNFKTNEELFEHNKNHERSEKNFSCEICNRVFISKSRLKAHMLTVHNDEREFKCGYCPSAFKTKSRLVDHTRCHTGEKPIKCHYCDEHFSRAAYRLKHERALHPELLEMDLKSKDGKKEKKN